MGRTGRGRAAITRVSGAADARTAQLRVVSGEFYPDWEAVYRDNVKWVYRLMYAKVGNRPDAEDLTAEVFLAALRPLRVSASAPEVAGLPVDHRSDGAGRVLAAEVGSGDHQAQR